MASITSAVLSISHDHVKNIATPVVKVKVKFTSIELQQMAAFPGRWFNLKCELWSKDTLFNDPSNPFDSTDNLLYTFNEVYYFPDTNQIAEESRTFQVKVGENLLNEDWGTDEIYAVVRLTNMNSGVKTKRNSNVVSHAF